jgi:hypothetical protein
MIDLTQVSFQSALLAETRSERPNSIAFSCSRLPLSSISPAGRARGSERLQLEVIIFEVVQLVKSATFELVSAEYINNNN